MDKVVVALVAFLTALKDTLIAFYAGELKQKLREAERDAQAVERANRAAAGDRSFDERVQYLKQHGRVRGLPKE